MLIREARAADVPQIARVHVDSWRTTYAGILPATFLAASEVFEARWRGWLGDPGGHGIFYVAELRSGSDCRLRFGLSSEGEKVSRIRRRTLRSLPAGASAKRTRTSAPRCGRFGSEEGGIPCWRGSWLRIHHGSSTKLWVASWGVKRLEGSPSKGGLRLGRHPGNSPRS